MGNVTLCRGVYLDVVNGVVRAVPPWQFHVNNSIIDATPYVRDRSIYIEIIPLGDARFKVFPFNVTFICNNFNIDNIRFRGDIGFHIVKKVRNGDVIDHKVYVNLPARRYRFLISAWGRINFPGGFTARSSHVVMYNIIARVDGRVLYNRTVDSGEIYISTPRFSRMDLYSYAVITYHLNNNTNTLGEKKPSPIDFSSIYEALGGSHSAVPIVAIIALVALVAAVAILRR